jgi:hypothetical protein
MEIGKTTLDYITVAITAHDNVMINQLNESIILLNSAEVESLIRKLKVAALLMKEKGK